MRVGGTIHVELVVHTEQVKEDKLNLSDSLRAQAYHDLHLAKPSIFPSLRSSQDLKSDLTSDQYLGGLKAETRVSTRSDIKIVNSQVIASSLSILNHISPIGNRTHKLELMA